MADRTINININITGNTGAGGGGTNTGGGGGSTANTERAKQKQMEADFRAHEQELLNIKKAADKQMIAEERAFQKEQANQQRTAAKQKVADEKAASKQILDQERATNKQRQAELRKAIAEQKNTWGGALSSYQFKFNALGNIISNVVSRATQMLYQLGSSVATISKDFEFAMSGVKAITNATDQEFNALRNDAIRLGGATLYTATEISNLQTELAKLGFSTSEIHSATDGVVALAAATGEDLAQSALVAGTVIRAFGLSANELTGVVDVMAQAFNASALDLYKFAETMKYVAPVAAKTGFTVSEVTAMMAKLADQGIVASQAGTSLRNLLLRLADTNSKLSKAIGGPVNSLAELVVGFNKLKLAGIGATELLKLTDRYSITAGLGLIATSESMWELYESMVSTSGAAKKMSDIRMDNFAGSVEKTKGAWDSFVLTINKGNGILRFAVDVTTFWIEKLTKLISTVKTLKEQEAGQEISELKKDLDIQSASVNEYYTDLIGIQVKAELEGQVSARKDLEKKLITQSEYNKKLEDLRKVHGKEVKRLEMAWQVELSDVQRSFLEDELGKQHRQTLTVEDNLAKAQNDKQLQIARAELNKSKIKEEEITKILHENNLERQKILADAYFAQQDDFENYSKEQIRLAKELADLKIDLMQDGFFKELAEVNKHYDELKAKAIEFGLSYKYSEIQRLVELNKIYKYYAELNNDTEIEGKLEGRKIKSVELSKDYKDNERELTKLEKEKRALRQKFSRYGEKVESDTLDPFSKKNQDRAKTDSFWESVGLSSEQEQALQKGFDFITNELQRIADKEVEIADRRVENSERVVDQLQQDLQTEVALAEAGFASNVTLKRKELEEAKRNQAKALAMQQDALKKQQRIEEAMQLLNLLTSVTGIMKQTFTKMDPIMALGYSALATGLLFGAWSIYKGQAKDAVKYGDGGEIDGPKHSAGGTMIEAEGGEFMVKASAYDNHKDLVQAINNEDMASVYRSLNQDLSVSLDDSNTARMLGRHFKDKKEVVYHDKCRIETVGNRRRVIRYA